MRGISDRRQGRMPRSKIRQTAIRWTRKAKINRKEDVALLRFDNCTRKPCISARHLRQPSNSLTPTKLLPRKSGL
jgi:hypothetical protein